MQLNSGKAQARPASGHSISLQMAEKLLKKKHITIVPGKQVCRSCFDKLGTDLDTITDSEDPPPDSLDDKDDEEAEAREQCYR